MPIHLKPVRLNTEFLRRVPVLAGLPEVKLQWIIDQGKEVRLMIDNAIDAVMACSDNPSSAQSEVVLHTRPLVTPTGW